MIALITIEIGLEVTSIAAGSSEKSLIFTVIEAGLIVNALILIEIATI